MIKFYKYSGSEEIFVKWVERTNRALKEIRQKTSDYFKLLNIY